MYLIEDYCISPVKFYYTSYLVESYKPQLDLNYSLARISLFTFCTTLHLCTHYLSKMLVHKPARGIPVTKVTGAREPWRERRDRSPNLYAVAPLLSSAPPSFETKRDFL